MPLGPWPANYRELPKAEWTAFIYNYHRKRRIAAQTTTVELVKALRLTQRPEDRAWIIWKLGDRGVAWTMPILVRYISDRSNKVRSEAGDAVGKVALGARRRWDERTLSRVDTAAVGEVLLKRYIKEKSLKHRNVWLPAALGAVGYRPAIPHLIASLFDPNPIIRGHAAWSLGCLRARNAVAPLRHAHAIETDSYAKERMWVTLYEIREGREWRWNQRGKS